MTLIDNEIALRIKDGDRIAFKQLFDATYLKMYFHCRKFIADPDEAKDILQNVFLRLWERRIEIDIQSSLFNYILRSVHNECLNTLRDTKGKFTLSSNEPTNELNSIPEVEDQFNDPDSDYTINEIEHIMHQAIEQLPEQCKIIFQLSRIDGLHNKEIAKRLNLSVRTVETQIYRALKLIRLQLKDYLAH